MTASTPPTEELATVRIYRLKLIIAGLALAFLGVLASLLGDFLDSSTEASHLVVAVVRGLSDVFLVTGAIGIAIEFVTGNAKDEADRARARADLKEMTPDFVDAVLRGFAVKPDDLARVATPELLDSIATNVLALRLGNRQFAAEVYEDIRDQAIRAPERWHDVQARIRLSPIGESDTSGVARFIVTASWEYTVVPSHPVARFACVSDKDEFHDLVSEIPATTTWFMTPRPGFDAHEREAFELLTYSIDGEERRITRAGRKSGQTYSVRLGQDVVDAGQPVRVSYTYRTITPRKGPLLHFEIDQPSRGISIDFDYSDTDISRVAVLDLIASTKRTRIERSLAELPGKSIHLDFDGWAFPRTGFAFAWALRDGQPDTSAPATSDVVSSVYDDTFANHA
ncbi:hypothetical protein [Salana multivorans]